MKVIIAGLIVVLLSLPVVALGQAADWQQVVWREPQVRYLVADMNLGGDVATYRYATEERDPDSREALRLWDAGAGVIDLKIEIKVARTNDRNKSDRNKSDASGNWLCTQ